jgi:membrane-associated phospholipid phosphatase
MKRLFFSLTLSALAGTCLYGETENTDPLPGDYPATLVFHDIGWNTLDALSYHYGLNLVLAGLETWAFIETGIDWEWRNIAYNDTALSNSGKPALYLGYIMPIITPAITYTAGRLTGDDKLQVTGLALTQALLLTLIIQTPLKMITGRALPGIVTELDHTRDPRTDDFSGEFDWFNGSLPGGWPSGHTANAFAAAAVLAELYSDVLWLDISVYCYAVLISIGITLDAHWLSESLAGALIGYAVGKTVGKSFSALLDDDDDTGAADQVAFYVTPTAIGLVFRF